MERTAGQLRATGVRVSPEIPDSEVITPTTHVWEVDASRVLSAVPSFTVTVRRKS